jgi:hypothetical protein
MMKRDRKQPTKIVSEEFKMWEKTGQAPGGLYGALETPQLQKFAEIPRKPDFMINPHRYFRDKSILKSNDTDKYVPIVESNTRLVSSGIISIILGI